VPAVAGALARDGGSTLASMAVGIRKSDVSASVAGNKLLASDRFNIGSVSKPVTGYLAALMIQKNILTWTTKIGDVFPEFRNAHCRARCGVRADYLDRTVEELMAHEAGFPWAPTYSADFNLWNLGKLDTPPGYTHPTALRTRRYQYVISAMQDAPLYPAGKDAKYSGGCIIVAAMLERKLGKTYEQILKEEVFQHLGMSNSGVGRLATSAAPNGTWQHGHDPVSGTITPHADSIRPIYDTHSHAPAGGVYMSAGNMAVFLKAHLSYSSVPKILVTNASLQYSHMHDISTNIVDEPKEGKGYCTRSGWFSNSKTDNSRQLAHDGDNGSSYCSAQFYPKQHWGCAAMTNVSKSGGSDTDLHLGWATCMDVINLLTTMHKNWNTLFPS
jgi:CubicO group peptidase (beta-lactamase class C family)